MFQSTLPHTDANTTQKMKFSIKDFFNKCDQIRRKLHFVQCKDVKPSNF